MPVYVEVLGPTLAPQDLQDLQRIYADAPDSWQLDLQAREQLIQQGLIHRRLLGARFNGRLLGAALMNVEEPSRCLLSYLCVRRVTRQRGVGQRLWDEASRLAEQSQRSLYLLCPNQEPMAARGHSLGALIRL